MASEGQILLPKWGLEDRYEALHGLKSRPLLLRIHGTERESDVEFSADEAMGLEKTLRAVIPYVPTERTTVKDMMESD